jgi:predicted nucleic acid-binding protein
MSKIFIDSNILIEYGIDENKNFRDNLFTQIEDEFPNFRRIYISDLVFNETHAHLTRKLSIDIANTFLSSLFKVSKKLPFKFELLVHKTNNHEKAFDLSKDPSRRNHDHKRSITKGLSMVDSLLILQMQDENGVIYTSDQLLSYQCDENKRLIGRLV